MSVATKVGIQINAKLGGEIWAVPIPVGDCFLLLVNFKFCFSRKLSWLLVLILIEILNHVHRKWLVLLRRLIRHVHVTIHVLSNNEVKKISFQD